MNFIISGYDGYSEIFILINKQYINNYSWDYKKYCTDIDDKSNFRYLMSLKEARHIYKTRNKSFSQHSLKKKTKYIIKLYK